MKKHALKFIQCLPEAMRPSTAVWVEEHFAGASSIKDGQLYLDIALLLHHRSRMQREGTVFMFAWGDSSKRGHLDMYNTRYRWLPADQCIDVARAFRWLCLNPAVVGPEQAEQFEGDLEDLQARRCECPQKLFDSIRLHIQMPQLLGQGRSKLIDKVGAHVQSALLEAGTPEALRSSLASCVAW